MHIRTPRAAVAIDDLPSDSAPVRQALGQARALITLWATRALVVHRGRVVGVRLVEEARLEVALVPTGLARLQWLPAEGTLSEAQANVWAQTSDFRAST